MIHRPTVSEQAREAEQLYTRAYTEYKEMFGDFKSMLSMYAEPGSMYPIDMTNLQSFIQNLSVQCEKIRMNKKNMFIYKGRERMEKNND